MGQLFGPGGKPLSNIGSMGILDRWAANAGRSEGATAEKAVPFLCAAPRSFSSRKRVSGFPAHD
jgi:hypothetical protein